MKKWTIFMVLVVFTTIWACSGNKKEEDKQQAVTENNDKDLGLVSADVADNEKDLLGDMPTYSKDAPGSAQTLERSFENAPPLIPHSTEGLVPITKDNNMCITCHMPDVAKAMKATPVPESHLTKYRPDVKPTTGKIDVEASKKVVEKDLHGKLDMSRYNCTQCHVPQANVDVAVQNKFEAVFRDKSLEKKSNLSSNIDEGVK